MRYQYVLFVAVSAADASEKQTKTPPLTRRHRISMPGPVNPQSTSRPFALMALSQLETFVDAYLSPYHEFYPIVHEATFHRAYG